MKHDMTRRDWLALSGLAAGAMVVRPAYAARAVSPAPTEPVSVAKVRSYDEDLTARFRQIFDQIGGLTNQVKGKTVGIKVNLTGGGCFPDTPRATRIGYIHVSWARWLRHLVPSERSASVFSKAPRATSAATNLKTSCSPVAGMSPTSATLRPWSEFEDTDPLGQAKQYSLLKVQSKPYVFPGFQLNHSYEDCDFFVSLAKMKNHEEMGLTLCIKNLFGITPLGVYKNRETVFHYGQVQAPYGVPAELDPNSNRYEGWRLPRVLVDILGARPVDLAIADGIVSMVGGEGPWVLGSKPCHPGILVVGSNIVNTDSVGRQAYMGYNPRAGRHEAPYRVYKNPRVIRPSSCSPAMRVPVRRQYCASGRGGGTGFGRPDQHRCARRAH